MQHKIFSELSWYFYALLDMCIILILGLDIQWSFDADYYVITKHSVSKNGIYCLIMLVYYFIKY